MTLACGPSGPTQANTPIQPAAAVAAPVAPVEAEIPAYEVVTVDGLDGIDLFGSTKVTARQIVGAHRALFEDYGRAVAAQDNAARLVAQGQLIAAIEAMGEFAFVDLSLINYFGPMKGNYLTIDLVDETDRAARMTFAPEPTGDVPDPEGALALWDEYMTKGMPLLRAGEIDYQATCPAFHCIANFQHPDLAPYLPMIDSKVASAKDDLVRVLAEDKDPAKRATAAFVLAHHKDGDEVVAIMARHIRDPSKLVRNNTLRVLVLIAMKHPEIEVPIDAAITTLRFPSTLDRNKASAMLSGLVKNPKHHDVIVREAGEILLAMLQLTQPNNHDFAYEIFKTISGQSHDARDYEAWHAWLKQARADAEGGGVSGP